MPDPLDAANAVDAADHLAGDGETDDAPAFERLVERVDATGGGDVFLTRPGLRYRFATQVAPETTGSPVRIVGVGGPTLDVSDVSLDGSGNRIDFRAAPNVTVERLRIVGAHGEGMQFSLGAGDGFRFSHLVLDTGQGGLNVDGLGADGIGDVHGQYLTARNHHDTDHGWASGLHVSGARDVTVSHIDVENCDRGIECDDGPTDVTLEHGHISDIDHRQASDAVDYTFSLDVHVHADRPPADNVLLENFVIEDSIVGFTARANDHNGQLSNVTFRHVKQVNTPAPRLDGAVTAEHVDLYADEWTPELACRIHGGSVRLRDWTVHYEPRADLIRFAPGFDYWTGFNEGMAGHPASERPTADVPEPDGITTEHRRHELRDVRCSAGDRLENGVAVAAGSDVDHLAVRDLRIDGACAGSGLVVGADGVGGAGGRYGIELVDSRLRAAGSVVDVADANAPVRVVRGSFHGASPRLPDGSTLEGVVGLDGDRG